MQSLFHLVTLSLLLVLVFGDETGDFNNTLERGSRNKRIVGGRGTSILLHPYFVSLEHNGVSVCGGAIVSALYVLTAAHCKRERISTMLVRAGSDLHGRGGSLHSIFLFTSHPQYYAKDTEGHFNDIAVILVGVPFQFDQTHQPISLLSAGERIEANSVATMVGFGLSAPNVRPTQLQIITIPVIDKSHCDQNYRDLARSFGVQFKNTPPGTFCAGYEKGGVDTCTGDSGGPVIIGGRLAGIVSNGISCGLHKIAGLNTDIPYFRQWIRDQIGF